MATGAPLVPYGNAENFRQDVAPVSKGFSQHASRYVGAELSTTQPDYLDRINYTARDYPVMFRHRRLQLQDTIEGFFLFGFEWYVYVLPWLITNEKHIKKNIYRHNVRPALPTPSKGVSRTDSHQTSTKEAHVQRLGRSFYMDGDMMGTDDGDRQYIHNCMGVAQGSQLAVNMATMQELIDCKNYVRDWTEYAGRRNFLEDVMEMEIARFAGMAASANYLEQVVQSSITAFQNRSLKPGAVIGWDTLPMLQSMVLTGAKTAFWQLGPDGRDVFVQGPDAITTIKNLPLFINRQFTLNEDVGPVQYCARDTTFGEKYEMSWNQRRGEFFGPGGSLYNSDQREIRIYDLDTDSWKPVTLKDAVLHSKIWDTVSGGYAQELLQAVKDANFATQKQNGFAEKFERYSDPARLDSEVAFTRKENMFYSHDTNARLMFLPQYIAQFDTDVVKTNDLVQMAHQYLQNAFGANYATYQTNVSAARDFVNRWETEANDSDEFWDETAKLNAPKSIDTNGKWIGEQAIAGAPRDWVPNARGHLDLVQYKAAYGLYAPGYANYPGFKEFVAQGAKQGWPLATVDEARKVVSLVETIAQSNARMAPRSRITHAASTPEWFHNKKAELTVWELLFGARAPIFLAAPKLQQGQGQNDGKNPVYAPRGEEAPAYNTFPGQYAIIGTLPLGALLSLMVKAAFSQAESTLVTDLIDGVVTAVQNNSDAEKERNAKEEQSRSNTLNTLINHIMSFKNEKKQYLLYYAVVNVYNQLKTGSLVITDEQRNNFFSLAKSMKINRTEVDKKSREFDAQFQAEAQATKASIEKKAGEIYRLGVADVEIVDFTQPQNLQIGAMKKELNAAFLATKSRTETPMTVLRQAVEDVEKLARRHGGNFAWGNLEAWSAKVGAGLSGPQLHELVSTIENYNAAAKNFDDTWKNVFSTAAGQKQIVEDDDDIDEPKRQGVERKTKRFFFRAPLSMTRHLLYQSSDNPDPRIRAADPQTGFRTMFYTLRTPEQRHYEEDPIMVMGRMPFMSDIGAKELHSLETASVLLQHQNYPSVDQNEIGYVAPESIATASRQMSAGSKYSTLSHKRKAPTSDDTRSKKRGVSFGEKAVAKTALQIAEEEAESSMRYSDQVRRRDLSSAFGMQQRGSSDDDDDDRDDKMGGSLPTGPLFYDGGKRGFYTSDEDGDSMREDEATRRMREEIGKQTDALMQASPTVEYSLMMLGSMAYRWERAAEQEDLVRMAMVIIMMTDASDPQAWVSLIDHNISPPFNILLWRLHITVSMYSAIVLVPGRETGVNIIGDRNFSVQEFNVDKIVHGHLTFFHKAIVWRDQNVDHLLDLYPHKVRGGWGMSWVEKAEEINQMKKNRGSCIAWAYPLGEEINKVAVSFIGDSIYRASSLATNLQDPSLAYSLTMSRFYADYVWKINRARTSYTSQIATFSRSREQLNVVAFSGPHFAWDKSKKTWTLATAGTGHAKGNKSGPGRRSVWMGQSYETFPSPVATTVY